MKRQWRIKYFHVVTGSSTVPTATLVLESAEGRSTGDVRDVATGVGPIDAICKAFNRAARTNGKLIEWRPSAEGKGADALARVVMAVDFGGAVPVEGEGESQDSLEAAARAYLDALNRFLRS